MTAVVLLTLAAALCFGESLRLIYTIGRKRRRFYTALDRAIYPQLFRESK